MGEIIRTRKIRTKSRQSTGGFKIDCDGISRNDILRIFITHEDIPEFNKEYSIEGNKILGRKSISFSVIQTGKDIAISWAGDIQPRVELKL